MRTTLVFVRHGESFDNVAGRFGGRRDKELTEKGKAQAQTVAGILSRWPVHAIVSSPLQRARQTAAYIASAHDLPVIERDGWAEADFGHWEGLTFSQVQAADPERSRQWMMDPLHISPPGGESFEALYDRVKSTLQWLLEEMRGKLIVVVAHGGSIRAALVHLLGMPLSLAQHVTMDPASITVVDDFDGHGVIRTMNCTISDK